MGSVDYDKRLHAAYERGRALSSETAALWMEVISAYVPSSQGFHILDIGSGTGRFSVPLAEWFEASVIGIEPSEVMRSKAKNACRAGHISYLGGTAEEIALVDDCVDTVFASMVVHHFDNMEQAGQEFARVLKPGGCLLVRNSFKNRLDSVRYYDFFPSGMEVDNARLPTIETVVSAFEAAGLVLEDHQVITQCTDENLTAYCERIETRALSTFEFISEEEFQRGVREMEEAARNEVPPKPVYEDIELLVFRKRVRAWHEYAMERPKECMVYSGKELLRNVPRGPGRRLWFTASVRTPFGFIGKAAGRTFEIIAC